MQHNQAKVNILVRNALKEILAGKIHPTEGSGHAFPRGDKLIAAVTCKNAKGRLSRIDLEFPNDENGKRAVDYLLNLFKNHEKYNAEVKPLGANAKDGTIMGFGSGDTIPPSELPKGKGLLGW
jgi:hypothetical protein